MKTYEVDYIDRPVKHFNRHDDVIVYLLEETTLSERDIKLIDLDMQAAQPGNTLKYDDLFISISQEEDENDWAKKTS